MVNPRLIDILLLALCWGPGFLFTKLAVSSVPPFTLVTLRLAIAALFLLILFKKRGLTLPRCPRLWVKLTLMGIFASTCPFVLFSYALLHIESVLSGLINGLTPLLTAILAHFYLSDERLSLKKISGILLGLSGFALLFLPTILNNDSNGDSQGMLFTFLASCCYAIGMVYSKRYLKQVSLLVGPVIQISTGAILLAPFAYFVDSNSYIEWEATALYSILALALLSTVCAFVLYYRIVAQSGAMALSMVTYILPIFSSILGVLFLDEQLSWNFLLAALLIMGGMLIVNKSNYAITKAHSPHLQALTD